ncbi:MAG TPA: hypothetical protein VFJ84_02030 [Candidatus Saccharimonadales bacterium]|nr:hypothetical protein [Candidatus Saccharimonadales bacterium]
MSGVVLIAKKSLIILAAISLVFTFPLQTWADTGAAADTAPSGHTGPNTPQGPDAKTYTYDSSTGMWKNAYYIWNPATGQATPITPLTYSYNPATGRWDTTQWVYDAAQGKYVPNPISVSQPPAGAPTTGAPAAAQAAPAAASGPSSPASTVSDTKGLYDNFYNASISNSLSQTAVSGSATVSGNTTAGSATSGNAADTATVINLLMSSAVPLQSGLVSFTQNIYGNVQGDITIDPSKIVPSGTISPAASSTELTINSAVSGQINNDINLSAASGNAAVVQNTSAGNAASGNADVIANVMNIINSVIGSGSSFMGTVNIYGSLDGDILLPEGALNSLLASGGAPVITQSSSSPVSGSQSNSLTANLSNSSSVTNTVTLSAVSGGAAVSNNTSGGNAATGKAQTNLTVLNLTGQQVIGSDALLVFVNVLGKWVGMIVNSPGGSTAAALGGGLTSQGPSSPAGTSASSDTNLNYQNISSIDNNITAQSTSGSATVSENTKAGNAASGNATASVNLLNISMSSLSLSNWLGVLFINVFGSWNGSFGINTSAGNKPPSVLSLTLKGSGPAGGTVRAVNVFGFVPAAGTSSQKSYKLVPLASAAAASVGSDTHNRNGAVIASVDTPAGPGPFTQAGSGGNPLLWTGGGLLLLAGALTVPEIYSQRQATRTRRYLHSVTVLPLKRS